jgi:hypothetical protein
MTSENPIHEEQPANRADDAVARDSQTSSQLTTAERNSIVDIPQPPQSYQIICKSEKDWRDKVKFWGEIVGLVFLVVYTIFTIKIARANIKAAEAATSAAATASATLTSSKQQFRMEERPYIWAYPVTGPNNGVLPSVGEKIYIRVDFKNSGRTPATQMVPTESRTIVGPKKEARRQAKEYVAEYPAISGSVFPPEVTGTAPTGYGPKLTEPILANINSGSWKIYVVGAVRYTDVFQPSIAPYETRYCFVFNPTGLPFGGCDFEGDSIK